MKVGVSSCTLGLLRVRPRPVLTRENHSPGGVLAGRPSDYPRHSGVVPGQRGCATEGVSVRCSACRLASGLTRDSETGDCPAHW